MNTLTDNANTTPELLASRKHRQRWWALAFVSLALAIAAMDTTIVNVAVPEIQSDLGASASSIQWILDSYYLVFAGLLLTMGSLGDRFGRRLLLQAGLVSFAGASLFAAFADSSGQLISARALTGIGAATLTPATLSIIIDTFPRHERAKAIAIWSATAGIGVPIGQVLEHCSNSFPGGRSSSSTCRSAPSSSLAPSPLCTRAATPQHGPSTPSGRCFRPARSQHLSSGSSKRLRGDGLIQWC